MTDLCAIKGIGPRRAQLFAELGIRCVEDLLSFYPIGYQDDTSVQRCADLEDGTQACVQVTVVSCPTIFYQKGLYIVTAKAEDASGHILLRWYNQSYRLHACQAGDVVYAFGRVKRSRGTVLINPIVYREAQGIRPIYAIKKPLTQRAVCDAMADALLHCPIDEYLGSEIRSRYDLPEMSDTLRAIHQPSDLAGLRRAQMRLAFDRALFYLLAVSEQKEKLRRSGGQAFLTKGLLPAFLVTVPFAPTDAQMRVLADVDRDMSDQSPMNRLIQGDVGSGKTLIAAYALYVCAKNGCQGVLLAPTEILARQHFDTLSKFFGDDCCLICGGMSHKERTAALNRLENGSAHVIIGTHALLQDAVRFSSLRLVVTDEQHRFGVEQRALIQQKGLRPDTLVMSATPIPRTLSLILYGDLDLSVIDQMPKGRKPVMTHLVGASRREALYEYLDRDAKAGRQSFIICPLIDASEGMEGLSVEEISADAGRMMKSARIGVLHGRMREDDKLRVMNAFVTGEIDVLVSTTVVEVGVHVPHACNMVIEGADRYGLATLHQLRGRVGRGLEQAHCFLLPHQSGSGVMARLDTLIQTNDGFEIAKTDLALRGTGELFGLRQHGQDQMIMALHDDTSNDILRMARSAAADILALPNMENNLTMEHVHALYDSMVGIAMN